MYRVLKEKGNNQVVTLENTETKASIILGKLGMSVMSTLEKEIDFEDRGLKFTDKWDLEISPELGKELAKCASPIKKPIRTKTAGSIKSEQAPRVQKKKTKSGREVVDVFDLIFGTEN